MQTVRRARRAVGYAGSSGVCEQCAPGTEPDVSQAVCVSCAAGFAGSDGTCAVCADGTEPNEDMTACQPCAPGWAGMGGVCSQCAAGSEPTADQLSMPALWHRLCWDWRRV